MLLTYNYKAAEEGLNCKPERLGEGSKIGKSPKVLRRGCKRSFGPTAQRSPKSLLHHVQPCFAPVQPQVAPVQEAFRSLGSKDLLHPLLTTFGDFPIFDPSPRRSGLQGLNLFGGVDVFGVFCRVCTMFRFEPRTVQGDVILAGEELGT